MAKKVKRKRKPGMVFWVTSSSFSPRKCVRVFTKPEGGDFIVVCRKHMAAVVAPAKLPRKGQWAAFRFTATPED